MNNYTIYCTEEQAKKALDLGAPIFTFSESFADDYRTSIYDKYCSIPPIKEEEYEDEVYADIPTAEQMKGWLRKKNIFINICHNCDGYGTWIKTISPSEQIGGLIGYYESEPQAILTAIDAALDYLINKKEE